MISHSRRSLSGACARPVSSFSVSFYPDSVFFTPHTSRMSSLVSGPVHFALIPDELWNPPAWINETKVTERMEQMEAEGIAKSGRLGCGFRLLPDPISEIVLTCLMSV